jgi:hypothetical protein
MKTSTMVRLAALGVMVAFGAGCGAEAPSADGEAIDETSQALTMQEAMVISLQATRDELKKTDKRIEATLSNLASNPNAVLDKKLMVETTQVSELSRADLEELRALVDLVDGQVGVASFA